MFKKLRTWTFPEKPQSHECQYKVLIEKMDAFHCCPSCGLTEEELLDVFFDWRKQVHTLMRRKDG